MIKFVTTLAAASTATVLAFGLAVPAMASPSAMTNLVQHPDGTLTIVKSTEMGKNSGKILFSTPDEAVETTVTPLDVQVHHEDEGLDVGLANRISDDPNRYHQWGLTTLDIEPAWVQSKGQGITVAVIDTGVDVTHPDFEGRAVQGYVAPGQTDMDKHGHGTHVAGIIAAGDNNGIATTGVAPDVKIWSAKVTGDDGRGSSDWMAQGIVEAVNAGVDVINVSMTANAPMPLVDAAINQANARGIPVFAAAGNDALKGSPTRWPAAYGSTIAVGSVTRSGTLSNFSNTNSYVDITAPGSAIMSLLPGTMTGMMSGTSQATPHVAGTAALLKALKPGITPEEIKQVLSSTATGSLKILDIHAALAAVGAKRVDTLDDAKQAEDEQVAPKPQKPLNLNAPKPVNPIRHFTRPER